MKKVKIMSQSKDPLNSLWGMWEKVESKEEKNESGESKLSNKPAVSNK